MTNQIEQAARERLVEHWLKRTVLQRESLERMADEAWEEFRRHFSAHSELSERLKGLAKKWREDADSARLRATDSINPDNHHARLAALRQCASDLEAELGEPSDELPMVLGRQTRIADSPDGFTVVAADDHVPFHRLNKKGIWCSHDQQPRLPEAYAAEFVWPSRAAAVAFLRECAAQQAASEPQQAGERPSDARLLEYFNVMESVGGRRSYAADQMLSHFNDDGTLKGDGKWRQAELYKWTKKIVDADSEIGAKLDAIDWTFAGDRRVSSRTQAGPDPLDELVSAVQGYCGIDGRDGSRAISDWFAKYRAASPPSPAPAAPQAEGGMYGTCDWGDCHKPANKLRMGLAICDDCDAKESAAPQAEPTTEAR
jgi:hypothetical protein